MRFVLAVLAVLVLALGSVAAPSAVAGNSGDVYAMAAQPPSQPQQPGGVPPPRVEPEGTSPAMWANLIWIVVAFIFLALLVGVALYALRGSNSRRIRE